MDSLATPEREAGAAVGVGAAATTGVSPFGHVGYLAPWSISELISLWSGAVSFLIEKD